MTFTAFSAIATNGQIHREGQLSYACFPAPTVQSHAANLKTLGDGRLGCVWSGGTQEAVADISIYFSALEQDPAGAGPGNGPNRGSCPSIPPGPSRTRSSSPTGRNCGCFIRPRTRETRTPRRCADGSRLTTDALGPRPRPFLQPRHTVES